LRKTLTYDRGAEMARHAQLTQNTGIKVYFADPYSPGSAARTRMRTGWSGSICPREPTLAGTRRTSSAKSPSAWTTGRARCSTSKRRM